MLKLLLLTVLFIVSFTLAADEPALLPVAAIKQDFAQLYNGLQRGSYDLYAHTPKASMDDAFSTMMAQIVAPMSRLDAHKHFVRFVALAQIVHTNIDFPIAQLQQFIAAGGKLLPLAIRINHDRITIADYYGNNNGINSIAVGDELIKVNDAEAISWLAQLQQYVAADNTGLKNRITEQQFAPLVWLHEGEQAAYQLTLRRSVDNGLYQITVPTLAFDQHTDGLHKPQQALSAEPREYKLIGDIGYLKPGPFFNLTASSDAERWDNTAFTTFIDNAFQHFRASGVSSIIIDLRNNPGGSNSFSDPMIAWFADRPFKFAADFRIKVSALSRQANASRLNEKQQADDISVKLAQFYARHQDGDIISFPLDDTMPNREERSIAALAVNIYALIDHSSYSNAVSVAAIIQDYGFGTVLGQQTADLATTYASMEHFVLHHSGIRVGYPKALIIRPNGNRTAEGVSPDVFLSGLDEAIAFIRSNRSGTD